MRVRAPPDPVDVDVDARVPRRRARHPTVRWSRVRRERSWIRCSTEDGGPGPGLRARPDGEMMVHLGGDVVGSPESRRGFVEGATVPGRQRRGVARGRGRRAPPAGRPGAVGVLFAVPSASGPSARGSCSPPVPRTRRGRWSRRRRLSDRSRPGGPCAPPALRSSAIWSPPSAPASSTTATRPSSSPRCPTSCARPLTVIAGNLEATSTCRRSKPAAAERFCLMTRGFRPDAEGRDDLLLLACGASPQHPSVPGHDVS